MGCCRRTARRRGDGTEDRGGATEAAGANRKRGNQHGPPAERQGRRSGTGKAEGRHTAANRGKRRQHQETRQPPWWSRVWRTANSRTTTAQAGATAAEAEDSGSVAGWSSRASWWRRDDQLQRATRGRKYLLAIPTYTWHICCNQPHRAPTPYISIPGVFRNIIWKIPVLPLTPRPPVCYNIKKAIREEVAYGIR